MDRSLGVVMTGHQWATVLAALEVILQVTPGESETLTRVRATHAEIDRQVKQQFILDSAVKGDHE